MSSWPSSPNTRWQKLVRFRAMAQTAGWWRYDREATPVFGTGLDRGASRSRGAGYLLRSIPRGEQQRPVWRYRWESAVDQLLVLLEGKSRVAVQRMSLGFRTMRSERRLGPKTTPTISTIESAISTISSASSATSAAAAIRHGPTESAAGASGRPARIIRRGRCRSAMSPGSARPRGLKSPSPGMTWWRCPCSGPPG